MKPLLALFLTAVAAFAETTVPAPTKGVDVSLVAESAAIAAGKPFTVGLKIHHHEGYHTYWRSPGIAGVPVQLDWKLPEGFSAGPIQWPYPEESMMAIHPVHGYERDVLLLVEITPPPAIGSPRVDLQATASWMACADGCYPGKKDLALSVPVAKEALADAALAEAFTKARAELPQPLEHWKMELLSAVDAPEIRLRLTPAGDQALELKEPYFFSSDGQISSSPKQTVEIKDGGAIEIVAPRAQYSPTGKTGLPGVLVSRSPLWKGGPRFAAIQGGGDGEAAAAAKCPECDK